MPFGDPAVFEKGLRDDFPRGLKGREDTLPRTQWAETADLGNAWDYREDKGLFLGYRGGREIGWSDDRHALTIAGTRAGKGTSLIIPNLLRFNGSVLAIDPKGELARITGRRRGELGQRVVLDPFGENGRWPSGSYNPLDELDPTSREVIDDAGVIADALIIYSGEGDPHWTSAARGLLRALILLVLDESNFGAQDRHLVAVREILMTVHPAMEAAHNAANRGKKEGAPEISRTITLAEMMIGFGDKFENVVRAQGHALKAMSDKERESVLSETRTQTQFLDSPALRAVLRKSDPDYVRC